MITPATYARSAEGYLGEFFGEFVHWLPFNERVLEAGCGLGQLVLSLSVRGYEVEGVEWAESIVELVRDKHPQLPIQVGDVSKLDYPDEFFGAYISLGVVEHNREGPEDILLEAWRVLKPGGIALVSVPWFNPLRRLRATTIGYGDGVEGLEFYQFAFTEQEFSEILTNCGFEVVEVTSYDSCKGLKDEISLIAQAAKLWSRGTMFIVRYILRLLPSVGRKTGHMMLVVCRKRVDRGVAACTA